MNDKEGSNHEDLNQNNEIKINIEENQIKQNNQKNENNQLKGGEAFLGVLKDEEEKKVMKTKKKLKIKLMKLMKKIKNFWKNVKRNLKLMNY